MTDHIDIPHRGHCTPVSETDAAWIFTQGGGAEALKRIAALEQINADRPCPHPATVTDEDGTRCDQCNEPFLGDAHRSELERAHQPTTQQPAGDDANAPYYMPCGICGVGTLRNKHGMPIEYHDCKPVPGAKLDACRKELSEAMAMVKHNYEAEQRALSEIADLRAKLAEAERGNVIREEMIQSMSNYGQIINERDAARAEADALKAEVAALKGRGVSDDGEGDDKCANWTPRNGSGDSCAAGIDVAS